MAQKVPFSLSSTRCCKACSRRVAECRFGSRAPKPRRCGACLLVVVMMVVVVIVMIVMIVMMMMMMVTMTSVVPTLICLAVLRCAVHATRRRLRAAVCVPHSAPSSTSTSSTAEPSRCLQYLCRPPRHHHRLLWRWVAARHDA